MKPRVLRWLSLADVVGIPLLVQWAVWREGGAPHWVYYAIPSWLLLSFLLHRDTPKTLGMRADIFVPAAKEAAVVQGALAAVILIIGLTRRASLILPPHYHLARALLNYFAFCVVQQVAINSMLMNRMLELFGVAPKDRGRPLAEKAFVATHENRIAPAAILSGVIFGLMHWPNPLLVPVTIIGGIAMTWLFARQRNILPLAIGHAVMGMLVAWAFPLAWHHNMRVGPRFYKPYR
jgi:hypothetical protein